MMLDKQKLLQELVTHIGFVCKKIRAEREVTNVMANKSSKEVRSMSPHDQAVFMELKAYAEERLIELTHLEGSPYFIKCDVVDEDGEKNTYFFSKHQLYEQSIYSWIAPVATIRFEQPGEVSYKLPDGTKKTITLVRKEQYMIVDGKVLFFALEAKNIPRELIYQEHFTRQKTDFALPEIVAQMEKAQDKVIRAGHKGPLVISGRAGSGKTTLALHRVAYLTQAPDTAGLYQPRSVIVFVQDTGTKDYFSTLLPGLGIHHVHITTFSEWAFTLLGLHNYSYVERCGQTEEEKDLYEYHKLRALREIPVPVWSKSVFSTLRAQYNTFFSPSDLVLFDMQKKRREVDRFDLTILLRSYLEKHGTFEIRTKYQTMVRDVYVQKTRKTPVAYSLMVIDEFQNYLPEQLRILKSCLFENTRSVIYVGDIAQQVKLGTIKDFSEAGESVDPERNIVLNKVYRNTKNILSFIHDLGYAVEILEGVKEGPPVMQKVIESACGEVEYIQSILSAHTHGSVGILAKNESQLSEVRKVFGGREHIHILTMHESQGVEFDMVFLIGISKSTFEVTHQTDVLPEHLEERKRMQKDLLYVALTRAITELHILCPEVFSGLDA